MPAKKLPKIIVVVGPTATGKSDFAVFLARKFNGEIISADSRQVYKGMDLGTGKITKKEMLKVPHHLLDVASPNTLYNVTKFKRTADRIIRDILKRGKVPFLVGGTGFWIDAVAFNQTFPEVKPDLALRARLDKLNAEKLFEVLKKIDPKRAATIDRNNKRRVIRAIEVVKLSKQSSTELTNTEPNYKTLFLGLDLPDEILWDKIKKRLDKRFKKGMVAEVKKLRQQKVSWKRLNDFGLEYRHVAEFLQGTTSKETMNEQLFYAVKKYAKRQRTWFKRNQDITWLDPSKKLSQKKAEKTIKEFLKQPGPA